MMDGIEWGGHVWKLEVRCGGYLHLRMDDDDTFVFAKTRNGKIGVHPTGLVLNFPKGGND